ncbi:hypothetical protein TBS_33060 [Thermobispora bispora]|jgi:hypothetical protein|uniref:DUF742 domain-containing protein n=1 Tax=Thermobispora bispora (strain ATCC 19993 / DSM 43833 / CBS 139.67 / JCM 10125 / KCTC 9307 / NBRC 14880 / R51) TaxID=469371 RepID=D6Y8Y1_THEBD|nr:DUF742 domain-containing protein [Thermobispora bispora]MBO2474882.1 DUF742 domain-containing protein [Actinomycetales bacterium]MDI9582100.1 DUF742 domain-containing protein [Thermobispora sp.]ADG89943.1 protein of unknown function DUF742 [Thermobispora bispora DSM 43833]MBX6167392.1 DUF742 domain-containing protein [Thermobispora bispora]QSI49515.1 DUF742 domain-containing protein [Thermobispora bispora]
MSGQWNPEEEWLVDAPTIRPYVIARGRTEAQDRFDLVSLVVTIRPTTGNEVGLDPEHQTIVRLCRRPLSVAEIAARMDLPAGIVRVLLGDLYDRGYIAVQQPQPETDMLDERMYKAVLDGLRAL